MSDESEESAAGAVVRVKYRSQTPEGFALEHGGDLSTDGIFIKTKSPLALGRVLRLQLMLADGERVISGTGRVRFRRDKAGSQPLGMGIEFVELDVASRRAVDAIVRGRGGEASRYDDTRDAEVLTISRPPERARTSSIPPGLFRGADPGASPDHASPSSRPPSQMASSTRGVSASTSPISGLFSSTPPPPNSEPPPLALDVAAANTPSLQAQTSSSPPAPAATEEPPASAAAEEPPATEEEPILQSSVPPPLPSQRATRAHVAPVVGTSPQLEGLFDDITLIGSERSGSEPPAAKALDAEGFTDTTPSTSDDEGTSRAEGSGRPTATSLVGLEGVAKGPSDAPGSRGSRLVFVLVLLALATAGFAVAFVVTSGGTVPNPDHVLQWIQDVLHGRAGLTLTP